MKKLIINIRKYWLLIFLVFSVSSYGQNNYFLLKASVNFPHLEGKNIKTKNELITPCLEFYLIKDISKSLSVNIGIKPITKGRKYNSRENVDSLKQMVDYSYGSVFINYIEIPVELQVLFDRNFFLKIGTYSGLYINCYSKHGSYTKYNNVITNKISASGWRWDFYNRFDFGINAGLGLLIAKKISLEFNYSRGLRTIEKNNDYKTYNSLIAFSIGYTFYHKKNKIL